MTIVVGIDYSEDSRAALRWAVAEGEVMRSQVIAVHTGPAVYEPLRDSTVARQRRANLLPPLEEFVGDVSVQCRIDDGPAAHALVAASEDADLVVVGRHGLGAFGRVVLGSVSHDVVRHAHCPVAVVPRAARTDVTEVVAGTDGSANAEVAVRWAAGEALRRGVPLHLVHAAPMGGVEYQYDEEATRAFVEDAAAKVVADVGAVDVRTSVSWLSAPRALLEAVTDGSLLVVGTHGRGAVARVLLGSTSSVVIEESPCTAVVVPFTH